MEFDEKSRNKYKKGGVKKRQLSIIKHVCIFKYIASYKLLSKKNSLSVACFCAENVYDNFFYSLSLSLSLSPPATNKNWLLRRSEKFTTVLLSTKYQVATTIHCWVLQK